MQSGFTCFCLHFLQHIPITYHDHFESDQTCFATGVEHRSKNRLADVGGFAEVLDLLRLQRWYRRQAHAVEFAHGELVHHAGIVKTFGRLIDGFPRCQDRCPLIPI